MSAAAPSYEDGIGRFATFLARDDADKPDTEEVETSWIWSYQA